MLDPTLMSPWQKTQNPHKSKPMGLSDPPQPSSDQDVCPTESTLGAAMGAAPAQTEHKIPG